MKIFSEPSPWMEFKASFLGKTLGFVPTMGGLHKGHESLIKRALEENDFVVVSIFVNPTQFNNQLDFKNYPYNLEEDKELCTRLGVPFLFLPNYENLYPDNYSFKVSELLLANEMEGVHRKGHFDGVLTVVLKLLSIIGADRVYMGEKDYQQAILVDKMTQAFFLKTKVVFCPTIREESGLAFSTRNLKLSKPSREKASLIYKALKMSQKDEAKCFLEESGFSVDYLEESNNRRFVAASLDGVRLIDNVAI